MSQLASVPHFKVGIEQTHGPIDVQYDGVQEAWKIGHYRNNSFLFEGTQEEAIEAAESMLTLINKLYNSRNEAARCEMKLHEFMNQMNERYTHGKHGQLQKD